MIFIDGLHLAGGWTLLVARSTAHMIAWQWAAGESAAAYTALLQDEELLEIIPSRLTKFNFSDNGSASVECALKMSFQYMYQTGRPERTRFMCLEEGYHGETIGALSVGAMDLYAKIYQPMLMDTIQVEAPDCYRCRYGKTRESCETECFAGAEAAFAEHAHETAAKIGRAHV